MRYITLLCAFLLYITACKTTKPVSDLTPGTKTDQSADAPATTDLSKQETWLLGYFNPAMMKSEPHSTWFYKGYDEYMFRSDAMNSLLDIPKDDVTIKVVLGTWCPDSRREVPRFMKIIDAWNFPMEKITFVGVDNAKQAPVGDFEKLDIQRVPTFIFYKKNIEAGRIIENPVTSLEQDMVNVLKEK